MQFIKQKLPDGLKGLKVQLNERLVDASLYACWLTLVALLWIDALLTGIWVF
tara:strand:- start:172 stop:327 length:156 start_codon:yes stop_codon:yes gene_type:complete